LLVYQSQVGTHTQLFTIKPDGSDAHQITRLKDSDAITAAWSPDGKRIAFARDYSAKTPSEHFDIVVMRADGSGLQAFGLHGLNSSPSWSADGRHIAWAQRSGFAIANPDGSGLRRVNVGGEISSPVFSPDGKRVAFWRKEPRGASIYIVATDGRGLKRVTAFPGGVGDKIDWSPDGSEIAFDTPAFGGPKSSNIYTIRIDGTALRQLTHATGGSINNGLDSWSPDGKKIAFVSNTGGSYEIYTMTADGTGVTQLTRGPEAHLAAWGTHP
jgi:Tol biopolymer transport system component